jgi:plastocyanin
MAVLIGIVLIAACAWMQWTSGRGRAATHDVDATGFPDPNLFVPQDITIVAGDTVRWTVTGTAPHDVTSDTDAFPASPTLSEGDTFDVTFSTAGEFIYTCTVHSGIGQYPGGMTGKVTVVAAATATATNTSAAPTATRTSGPSSTPTRTPTGTVTAMATATQTPAATVNSPTGTPAALTHADGAPVAGDARSGITGPQTGGGPAGGSRRGRLAAALGIAGLSLIASSIALPKRRT